MYKGLYTYTNKGPLNDFTKKAPTRKRVDSRAVVGTYGLGDGCAVRFLGDAVLLQQHSSSSCRVAL